MRQRDYFNKKAKKTNHAEDWANYRHFRNQATNSMKKAKAAYNRCLIINSGNDHRAFWKTLKKVLPGENKAISQNLNINGTLTNEKPLIADSFNKSFTSALIRLVQAVRPNCAYEEYSM